MDFLQRLIETDQSLLLTMNGCHSPFWDRFFWLVTGILTWVPFYLVLLYAIVKNQKKGSVVTILTLVILVVLCDQISNHLFKEFFERWRPSRDPSISHLVHTVAGYKGGNFGFVSGHATNSFGLALFSALLIRHWGYAVAIFLWAFLNSYSRIYLGVHFPGDILGGMLLGMILATGVFVAYVRLYPRFAGVPYRLPLSMRRSRSNFKRGDGALLVGTLVYTVVLLAIAAKLFLKMGS
ncbi:undecaprenyl-diphosphatase [Breznakibacter xylanolyticus]|uniref:Undecaprenyl-diphosphatase n=1 Tax=Breznakibacter xylanolyticus TaxID=990 RepID=A0A2W7NIN3_9BACT|nr:phosphatase PAP2 family protein [Breznakibacter xylanolyticus]PZX20311.1 undecaprenyl-diphosphatase [Breznakibacter xylanolyticus]